jgi:ABC-type multidrug transport system fused ATPase/permease subunit
MSTNDAGGRMGGLIGLYRALWRHADRDRRFVVLFMALLVAAQTVHLSIPYFTAQAINAIQAGGFAGFPEAGRYLALMFGAAVVIWALHGPGRIVERFVAVRIRERFADALLGKALDLPMRWHEARHSGDTIARLGRSSGALFGFAQNQFVYLQNAVNLFGPIVALTLISWRTGAASIAGYALIAVILFRFDTVMMRLARQENAADNRHQASLIDALGNISTVLALRLQAATRRAVGGRLAEVSVPLRRGVVVNEVKWCVIDLLTQAVTCGVVALYGWLAWREGGAFMVGSALMVLQYAQQSGGVIHTLASQWQALRRTGVDYASGAAVLDEPTPAQGASMLPVDWREIAVEGLDFGYAAQRSDKPALREIALTLKRGQRIALVGESGSGKSTLLRVMAGLYEPDAASYRVDGAPLSGLAHLGAVATLIPQDPEVFEASLAYNLSLGREDAPEAVRRACDIARLTPVLEGLPAGL